MLESMQNLYFLLERLEGLFIVSEYLVLDEFDSYKLVWVLEIASKIDLGGPALAKLVHNLVLFVENGVFLGALRCGSAFGSL